MKTKFAKTAENQVERITSTHVQVTVLSGPSKGKAYAILATATCVGSCTCSWGRRNGTTCSHVRDAQAFVDAENAVKIQPVAIKKSWLEEEIEDGLIVFASQCS